MIRTQAEVEAKNLENYTGAEIYGLHWGDPEKRPVLLDIRKYFIEDLCRGTVLEIGSGGGRWTRYLKPLSKKLICVDGTAASKDHVTKVIGDDFEFHVCTDGNLDLKESSLDYVFSFDVFVHFHPRLFNNYLASVARAMKSGADFVLHYAIDRGEELYDPVCYQYREPIEITQRAVNLGLSVKSRFPGPTGGLGNEIMHLRKL